jgi:hypothetical protein
MSILMAFFNTAGDWMFLAGLIVLAGVVTMVGWARKLVARYARKSSD